MRNALTTCELISRKLISREDTNQSIISKYNYNLPVLLNFYVGIVLGFHGKKENHCRVTAEALNLWMATSYRAKMKVVSMLYRVLHLASHLPSEIVYKCEM